MNPELDCAQLLTQLSREQSTGCLEIIYGSTRWQLFLRFGQLLTADYSIQSLDRLAHHLRQLGYSAAADAVTVEPDKKSRLAPDHGVRQEIEDLALQGLLDREQLQNISVQLTKEAVEPLLWLTAGEVEWHPNKLISIASMSNISANLKTSGLIDYYRQRLIIWQKFTNIVESPHQRPYLTNERFLDKAVPHGTLSPKALSQISQLMKGLSLRNLALFLKQDELKLVKLLTPYIRHNVICLREPSAPFNELPTIPEPPLEAINLSGELTIIDRDLSRASGDTKVYQIACIDDSPMILDEMERFLGNKAKYKISKFEEPIKASGMIFRLKPDLILMDITMPNINGYKLCSLFRNSEVLAETPIVMVTGNRGLIDKARAKLVGATDYLTKPFTEEGLLTIVDKYLNS